jgi:hypothetical protein
MTIHLSKQANEEESTCLSSQNTFSETRDILEVNFLTPVEVTERFVDYDETIQ